jgi:ferredoxin
MNNEQSASHIISINPDRCQGQGHSRCCMLVLELFDSDDLGYGLLRGEDIVPNERLYKAKLAVANCPEFAIVMKRTEQPAT